jgi:hypothetical protein
MNIASNARIVWCPSLPRGNSPHQHCLIPDRPMMWRGQHVKYVSLSLLHNRLGNHALWSLLAADAHKVWQNTRIRIEPETDCVTCQIATIRATNRNKLPHTLASHPGATVSMDILPCKSNLGLTPKTTHDYCLILVDTFLRFSVIYGLLNKSMASMVQLRNVVPCSGWQIPTVLLTLIE